FGPLIPRDRAPAGEEELEELRGAIAPAQAHEGPDVAQLVGRVIVPGRAAVSPVVELAPVTLVGGAQQWCRQILGVSARREGDACRRRVEIAELRRARHVGDAVRRGRSGERGREIAPEFLALLRET